MSFIVAIGLCGGIFATGLTVFPVSEELITQAPFLFKGWQAVDSWFWIWMGVIATGACLALSMMTRAYQLAETSYAAIYEYAYLISVGIFSWAFWGVIPGMLSIAGIGLIIFAGILIVLAQQDIDQPA
jgi:drug/metabolite transporter (DMT)-like permease